LTTITTTGTTFSSHHSSTTWKHSTSPVSRQRLRWTSWGNASSHHLTMTLHQQLHRSLHYWGL
jgi:hypothetical protein